MLRILVLNFQFLLDLKNKDVLIIVKYDLFIFVILTSFISCLNSNRYKNYNVNEFLIFLSFSKNNL